MGQNEATESRKSHARVECYFQLVVIEVLSDQVVSEGRQAESQGRCSASTGG